MKQTSKRISTLLVGAAFVGLMTGASTLTSCSGSDTTAAERNGCNGPNGCKGHETKKEANGCNGPNGCKSQDTKKEANGCKAANGCKEANGCKGEEAKRKV